jgi:predicted nucleic acid-binding protein
LIVVSDTSPLLNLIRIGHLELLHALYLEVTIPPAVQHELVASFEGSPLLDAAMSAGWLRVIKPVDGMRVAQLTAHLDAGESEAIVLAQELRSDLLLMDERKGRQIAFSLGLNTVGLLGILVEAKREGHIQRVKPLLDALVNQAKFWVGAQLYRRVLDEVGE